MKVKVYAKLNLSLNVLGAANGFHQIDSVVTSVDVFDELEVTSRPDNNVTVRGMANIATRDNAAYKAACAFCNEFGVNGTDIVINKGIPVGAGMGGSSADIAGVIYCMCKLYDVDFASDKVAKLCAALGSDVNYMLLGGLARISGKGDYVESVISKLTTFFAVTVFNHSNSTAEIYSACDKVGSGNQTDNDLLLNKLTNGDVTNLPLTNGLEKASSSLSSYAQNYLSYSRSQGCKPNMTGSGSAYYIVCGSYDDALAVACDLNAQGFNTFACKSVGSGIEEI